MALLDANKLWRVVYHNSQLVSIHIKMYRNNQIKYITKKIEFIVLVFNKEQVSYTLRINCLCVCFLKKLIYS